VLDRLYVGRPGALAKALTTYAKANPTFTFRAGMVEGRVVDVSGIQALATLPSKEESSPSFIFDQRPGTAPGDRDQRSGQKSRRGHRPGCERKQVFQLGASGQ